MLLGCLEQQRGPEALKGLWLELRVGSPATLATPEALSRLGLLLGDISAGALG